MLCGQLPIFLIILINIVFLFLLNNLYCFAFLRLPFPWKTVQILHYLFELVRNGRDFNISWWLGCVPFHWTFASIVVVPGRRRRLLLTMLSLSYITVWGLRHLWVIQSSLFETSMEWYSAGLGRVNLVSAIADLNLLVTNSWDLSSLAQLIEAVDRLSCKLGSWFVI